MWDAIQQNVIGIWISGGMLMIPLALLGLFIYFTLFDLLLRFGRLDFYKTSQNDWHHWVERPDESEGEIANMLEYIHQQPTNTGTIRSRIAEIQESLLPPLERRIHYAAILVSTAPLTGLLGTVVGMLSTFRGLSVAAGGSTLDFVAGGISEALITTQTGLVLAIPGYILINQIKKEKNRMQSFFTQFEIKVLHESAKAEKNKVA